MRTCVLDIETTDLAAIGAGWMLCAVLKPVGGRAQVYRYDEYKCSVGHEKKMLEKLCEELSNYQLWVGHNIAGFDWPYLRSRAYQEKVMLPPVPWLYDTVQAFRRMKYRTRPNRIGRPIAALDHVVDFFGIQQKKTKIYPREHWLSVWEAEAAQRTKALDGLVEHCVSDVEMTEAVYWKLLATDTRGTLLRAS